MAVKREGDDMTMFEVLVALSLVFGAICLCVIANGVYAIRDAIKEIKTVVP